MDNETTGLRQRIASGKPLLLAEISPPQEGNASELFKTAKGFAGKVHALGISDNRERVTMSALAAASIVASKGIEPILHVITRDSNRIALVSEALGAQALGICNLLCTSGTHQVLGAYRAAKNVFDIDPVQLLKTYSKLDVNGSLVGTEKFNGSGPFCLGAVAAPYADPLELQLLRLAKKIRAGAQFLVTQPVYDLQRFKQWWQEILRLRINEKAAFIAGIQPLVDAQAARNFAASRPSPCIPEQILSRLSAASDSAAQRSTGIAIALETIKQIAELKGLRGFQIYGDRDNEAALEVIEKSGLSVN
ncbi:MAG: methylenetetrahydrofolate reductase [Thermoguttaceae bacterium]